MCCALAPDDVTAPLREGLASLLCHWHDDNLRNQRSLLIPGIASNTLALGRFFIRAPGVATSYLAKRGLPRPVILWADVIRIKRRAQAIQRARDERL